MGFALWVDDELAWSEGRHEYQPLGRAVIARTDLFRERDFRRSRRIEPDRLPGYVGLFASLGEVNAFLANERARRAGVVRRSKLSDSPEVADGQSEGADRGIVT
jgi:hypothetical protein